MSKDIYSIWGEDVRKVARFVAKDFPNVDRHDIEQELWVRILETPKLKTPDQPGAIGVLSKMATTIAWNIRKEGLYSSAQYDYRPSDVRFLLSNAFAIPPTKSYLPDDPSFVAAADSIIIDADIQWAFEHLPLDYKRLIFRRHVLDDYMDANEKRRYYRAVDRLVDILNTYRPDRRYRDFVGSRRAINNATARYILEGNDG